jgi:5-formyltetrahydrofolate cyclo-ligase
VKGPHGILEPSAGPVVRPRDVRAWLVPGLAFTRKGGRLGYGGGWYDRLLCKVPKRVPKIGIAYAFQLVDELPTEPHDICLTSVVSCDDLADVIK